MLNRFKIATILGTALLSLTVGDRAWSRGGGRPGGASMGGARPAGGGGGMSAGNFSRGAASSGFGGMNAGREPSSFGAAGGGFSGGGFRPQTSAERFGGTDRAAGGNFDRSQLGSDRFGEATGSGFGANRPGVVHLPESGGGLGASSSFGSGTRPQLGTAGGFSRQDLNSGNRNFSNPAAATNRAAENTARLPGLGGATNTLGTASAGAAGSRFGTTAAGARTNSANLQASSGNRFTRESAPQRSQNLSSTFDNLQGSWGDGNWHSWTGPNGGQINHIGFWGPNGYWGHTGAWGPNGGYVGHTTGLGPNGGFGRTTAWAPGSGPPGYWSRSWGWYNGYGTAWGYGRWDYLWNQHPVAAAFGVTMWGVNAVGYAMGVGSYSNPYYTTGSSPVAYDTPMTGDPSYEATQASTDSTTDALTQLSDQARDAFQTNQFAEALALTEQALKQAPRDAALNEFRSLCLFSLGRYRDSAATIHAVLAAGPGWNWATLIGLYSNYETYADQLRRLEVAVSNAPNAADVRFLLAYHYLTADHTDAAVEQWREVVRLQPDDKLSAQLLQMYASDSPTTTAAPPANATAPELDKPAYPLEKLLGEWHAEQNGGRFTLKLENDGTFGWSFLRDDKPQTMSGAYTVRGNNLVLQPDGGGTMLSTITLTDDGRLQFAPIGEAEKLIFQR